MNITDRNKNVLAVLLMLAIVACVFAVGWANGEAVKLSGPSNVQQGPNGNIYVVVNKEIYILDASGTSKRHIKLTDFGIQDGTTWLQVLNNGELLIGDYEAESIKRCNLNTLRCNNLDGSTGAPVEFSNSFQFYMDENRQRIYATDTLKHSIYILDTNGKLLTSADGFKYPNRPFISDDGLLYVADTNHHRIVKIDVSDDRFSEDKWQFKVTNDVGRAGRNFPIIARQDHRGSWWVINAKDSANGLASGDLIIYDAQGIPQKRIDLGDDSEPTHILLFNDKVLVSDVENYRIASISPRGEVIGNFGDQKFFSYLDSLQSSKAFYSYIKIAAYAGLGISVLLALGLALYANKQDADNKAREQQDKTQTTPAEVNRLIWIEKNEKLIKMVRMSSIAMISLPILYSYVLFDMSKTLDSDSIIFSAIFVLFMFATGLVGLYMYKIYRQTKIGTDGNNIYFTDHNGQNYSIDPNRVMYSANMIAYKNIAIPFARTRDKEVFARNKRGIFSYDQIQQYILPRLSPSKKMGSWAIHKYLFSNASDFSFGLMFLFLMPCIMMILLKMHEKGLLASVLTFVN